MFCFAPVVVLRILSVFGGFDAVVDLVELGVYCGLGWVTLAVLVILLDFLGLGCLGLCGFEFAVLVLAAGWFGC